MSEEINKKYLESLYTKFVDKETEKFEQGLTICLNCILSDLCDAAKEGKREIKRSDSIKQYIPRLEVILKEKELTIRLVKSDKDHCLEYYMIGF